MSNDQSEKFCGDDHHPIAFRVHMTGIIILDSSYLGEGGEIIQAAEAVEMMEKNSSLAAVYVPQDDSAIVGE